MSILLRSCVIAACAFVVGSCKPHWKARKEERLPRVHVPSPPTYEAFIRSKAPDLLTAAPMLQPSGVGGGIYVAPPQFPPAQQFSQLPEGPAKQQYLKQLHQFFDNRSRLAQLNQQYAALVDESKRFEESPLFSPNELPYIAKKIASWNGDIQWAPASKSTDIILRFGDEVRAVFGPIPPFDVTTLGKRVLPDGSTIETAMSFVEVDGNRVQLKPNPAKPGSPLEWEHRNSKGDIVKWTSKLDKCDKPSLAGGVTPCGTASRVSRTVRGTVEWIALARKTKGAEVLTTDDYWSADNPYYTLLGYIGFNQVSGELTFFDGTYEGPGGIKRFNWLKPVPPPGGSGYADDAGRTESAALYDATFSIGCTGCHDNKEPRIITPYMKQARVGYRNDDIMQAFSMGALLPQAIRNRLKPYRVVGSDYTAVHRDVMASIKMVTDPSGKCTSCHPLTSGGTARFASDSVGRLEGPENGFRTDWSLRTGEGKIYPWMVPGDGNVLSADPPPDILSDVEWDALKKVLEKPDDDPTSIPLYTSAPAPESVLSDATRIADPSAPSDFVPSTAKNRDDDDPNHPKEVQLSWKYWNSLGGIPERDDVRFNLAIAEVDIPAGGAPPQLSDFPTIEQAKGRNAIKVAGEVYRDGVLLILKDISFAGHKRWTDPPRTTAARDYKIAFPAKNQKRYLLRLVAKRYTFDQEIEKFSSADHVFAIDTN